MTFLQYLKNYNFFQLLVLVISGAGAIFQLLVLAIFGESTNPLAQNSKQENNALDYTCWRKIQNRKITLLIIPLSTTTMQGFDEFCDYDNDNAGVAPHPPANVPPVIGVGAGASVASAGAASLGL